MTFKGPSKSEISCCLLTEMNIVTHCALFRGSLYSTETLPLTFPVMTSALDFRKPLSVNVRWMLQTSKNRGNLHTHTFNLNLTQLIPNFLICLRFNFLHI